MEMAEDYGIANWRDLVRVRSTDKQWSCLHGMTYDDLELWQQHKFALGMIEDKPVFAGDRYYNLYGRQQIAVGTDDIHKKAYWDSCTWELPKPELPKGYTPWEGGEWPGHPKDIVSCIFASGISSVLIAAEEFDWKWGASRRTADIIGYKIIEKYEEPKTVMVELPLETVKMAASCYDSMCGGVVNIIGEACRKKLEETK